MRVGVWRDFAPGIRVAVVYAVCVVGSLEYWGGLSGAHCALTVGRLVEHLLNIPPRDTTPVVGSSVGVSLGLLSHWDGGEASVWVPLVVVFLSLLLPAFF